MPDTPLSRGPRIAVASPAPHEADDLARVLGFLHGFARRRASRVLPAPGGFAVLDDRYPGSYDDNKLIVTTAPDPDPGRATELLLKAADELLATRAHRLICVDDDRLGTACAPAFEDAGYERETTFVMTYHGELPESPPPVERLELSELIPVLRRDWRQTLPQAPDDVIEGLARRVETRLDGADVVRFYGVRAPDGEVAARADLYVHGGVAQIENVFTSPAHRGSGHARTLMTALLAEAATLLSGTSPADTPNARHGKTEGIPIAGTGEPVGSPTAGAGQPVENSAAGAGEPVGYSPAGAGEPGENTEVKTGSGTGGLIFLLADADDWPHQFYRRLGFTPVARTHAFLHT
ncbi:GNAT family N-acetyltransferase [Nonomuraea sp. NPDC052634]|uniref:GNAT family N-acetyltransferase n=1 Tax=Nonomuraea sp. NPDC052634 TaxID=3155813 RepID=UPI0034243462